MNVYWFSVLFAEIGCLVDDFSDTSKCRVMLDGMEYAGNIGKTESGIPCKNWASITDNMLNDANFSDGSMKDSKNYCRNPKSERKSKPWCYTTNYDVIWADCDVKLCAFTNCRLSGAGVEYAGSIGETVTNRECQNWSERTMRKYLSSVDVKNVSRKTTYLRNEAFPEHSRKKAGSKCRNPTADENGPWCLVKDITVDDQVIVEREYCAIPICDISDCAVVTAFSKGNIHRHWRKLPSEWKSDGELKLGMRLWKPENFDHFDVRVALAVLPIPATASQLTSLGNGLEILIANSKISFTTSGLGNEVKNVLSGIKTGKFAVNWDSDQGQIGYEFVTNRQKFKKDEPYGAKNKTLVESNNGTFSYYSVIGANVILDSFCGCEEYVTTSTNSSLFRHMRNVTLGHEAHFYVRGREAVILELRNGPTSEYPKIRVEIYDKFNRTTISVLNNASGPEKYIGNVFTDSILSFWEWKEFYLNCINNRLQLMSIHELSSETILDVEHVAIRNMKWYTFGSKSTAYWGFNCLLHELSEVPNAFLPECIVTEDGGLYQGTQSFSAKGSICLPWIHEDIQKLVKETSLVDKSYVSASNYCRNPSQDKKGPFCYIADPNVSPNIKIKKEYCQPRYCSSSQCRVSGTGSEYSGLELTTKSGSACKNTTNENFCRNENQDLFGPWCATDESDKEYCYIPDCLISGDACNVIYTNKNLGYSKIFVNPAWILDKFQFDVKTWNPTKLSGVELVLKYRHKRDYYKLTVGESNIVLKFVKSNGNEMTLKEAAVPNLVAGGNWKSFWIHLPPKDIALGFEGKESPVLQWSPTQNKKTMREAVNFIGVAPLKRDVALSLLFPCYYCFMVITEPDVSRSMISIAGENPTYYPLKFWNYNQIQIYDPTPKLILHMRTRILENYTLEAATSIVLYYTPNRFIVVTIKQLELSIADEDVIILDEPLLQQNRWTTIEIEFHAGRFIVEYSKGKRMKWNQPSSIKGNIVFSYFSIVSDASETTWIAHCSPPDIDHSPISGGWSEWDDWVCDADCGGGLGYRKRYCNNPAPNLMGNPCEGASREEGECNIVPCGYISPKTFKEIKGNLQRESFNIFIGEGYEVSLSCDLNILEMIKKESPESTFVWLKNGFKMPGLETTFGKLTNQGEITFQNVERNDAGLYTCVVYPFGTKLKSMFEIVKIVSLTVKTSYYTNYARETDSLKLTCNSALLELVYGGLTQSWIVNDILLIDYSNTRLIEASNDELLNVIPEYAGIWECQVAIEANAKMKWVTQWMNVKVLEAPTWLSIMIEMDAPRILFGAFGTEFAAFLLISIAIFTVAAVSTVVYYYIKWRQELLNRRM